jgi:hypothetical protein
LLPALMRPVLREKARALAQHAPQVSFVQDRHVVEAFPARRCPGSAVLPLALATRGDVGPDLRSSSRMR